MRGARYYLTEVPAPNGRLAANDLMMLDEDRVAAEWYLWKGERPAIHSYAKKSGYIAVRYGGELFHLTSNKVHFRWFGVIENKVQQNLTIILEPQLYQPSNGRWGVHPDQSRNRLIFSGNGEKGVELPLSDWGLEFADNMPQAIVDVIREARGGVAGRVEDENYRKRLQERFGDRWRMKVMVAARNKEGGEEALVTEEEIQVIERGIIDPNGIHRRRRKKKIVKMCVDELTLLALTEVSSEKYPLTFQNTGLLMQRTSKNRGIWRSGRHVIQKAPQCSSMSIQ